MTQRELYNIIINGNGTVTDKNEDGTRAGQRTINLIEDGVINPEIIAYAQASIDKLNDRNSNRKASPSELAKATERTELDEQILNLMEGERTYTCNEIATATGKNTQTITSAFNRLMADGKVTRIDNYKPAKGKSKCKGYVKA